MRETCIQSVWWGNLKARNHLEDLSHASATRGPPACFTRRAGPFVNYVRIIKIQSGPGSSVGIATDYGLDGPGIGSRWGRDFLPVQTGPGTHLASCTMGTGSFPGVKCGRGVLLTTHPLLAPRSWKSRAISLPPSGPQPGL